MADLCGQPLLWHTLEVARLVPDIDLIVVSSEDSHVLDYATRLGFTTHERDVGLSGDKATNRDVLRAVVGDLAEQDAHFDAVVLLQPTHPLRRPQDISAGLESFFAYPTTATLITVVEDVGLFGRIDVDGYFHSDPSQPRKRDEANSIYRNCGSFYVLRVTRDRWRSGLIQHPVRAFVASEPRFEIDIDHPEDMAAARLLLSENIERFPHVSAVIK